ncbi:MAG: EamA family transporter [Candidatus Bathyarchaeia archaeon]
MQVGWFNLSLVTLVLWGFWGFLGKITIDNANWKSVFFFSVISQMFFIVIFYVFAKPSLAINMQTCYAMLVGIVMVAGLMTFYQALEHGKVSVVVPLTAMYPLVTIILAVVVLKEELSPTQGIGVLLAIVAVVLISIG